MSTEKYMDVLTMIIYDNCLSKRSRRYNFEENMRIQTDLALAVARKDINTLEEMVAYYEGVETMLEVSIKYGTR